MKHSEWVSYLLSILQKALLWLGGGASFGAIGGCLNSLTHDDLNNELNVFFGAVLGGVIGLFAVLRSFGR